MDIGSIFLILGILILVVLYVSQPLMQRKSTTVSPEEHAYSALMAERDRVVNALQELDFDFSLGKIPQESYKSQRTELLQSGAATLRQIDLFRGEPADEALDAHLEAEIESRRKEAGTTEAPLDQDDELEALIASRRRARNGKSGGFCSQCGNPIQRADRFCPKCGHLLT